MTDEGEASLAEQFGTLLKAFNEIADPSISDVSDLAKSLGDVLENVSTGEIDNVSMAEAINVLLDSFTREGLSETDYLLFYQDLSDDVTEDDFVTDLQHLIYTYLIEMSENKVDGGLRDAETLALSSDNLMILYAMLIQLISASDSGLETEQMLPAYSTLASAQANFTENYPQSSITELWSDILQDLQDAGVDSDLIISIDLHFEAIFTMMRNINYSNFASGLYFVATFLALFSGIFPTSTKALALLTTYLENYQESDDGFITGKNLLLAFTDFINDTEIQNGLLSEDERESFIENMNLYIDQFTSLKQGSSSSLVFPSLFTTSVTGSLGVYAIYLPDVYVEVISVSAVDQLFSVFDSNPEVQTTLISEFTELLSSGGVTLSDLSDFGTQIFDYALEQDTDQEVINVMYSTYTMLINSLQSDGISDLLGSTVNESYYSTWGVVLATLVQSELMQSTESYMPTSVIANVILIIQNYMFELNNTPDDGLTMANFLQMQIELIEYLSFFLDQDQLDVIAEYMNVFVSSFPEEEAAEEAAEEALELWIQIGVAIALLIVSVVISVLTLGIGTGAAVALDAAVVGAEVAVEAGAEVAAEVAGEVIVSESVEEISEVVSEEIVEEVIEEATESSIEQGAEDLTEELTEESLEQGVEETTEDSLEQGVEETTEDSLEQGAEDSADEVDEQGQESEEEEEQGDESEDEDEEAEEEEEDPEECAKNFQTYIESAVNSGSILVLLASVIDAVKAVATYDSVTGINNVTTIVSNISGSLAGLCTSKTSETKYSQILLSVMWALNSKVSMMIDVIIDEIPDPNEGALIAQVTIDFLFDAYYVVTGLISLISAIQAVAEAQGGVVSPSFASSLKANIGNVGKLKDNIEGIQDYVD